MCSLRSGAKPMMRSQAFLMFYLVFLLLVEQRAGGGRDSSSFALAPQEDQADGVALDLKRSFRLHDVWLLFAPCALCLFNTL